jgi:DNA polymerase I-like protein with 3'-5' exonuclease and polymerase domains
MPKIKRRIISIDTETTGLDCYHGARPFLVTTCNQRDEVSWWEWPVDPLTRKVQVIKSDLLEIQQEIDRADELILQNPKFDYKMLYLLFQDAGLELRWDWTKVRDTLLAGHLLASNQPHDLTTMGLVYLGINIEPLEDGVKKATQEARRLAKNDYPTWRLAKVGLPEMPSAKESTWKYDMWLPRAIAETESYPENHEWWTVCSEYANGDSAVTLPLYLRQAEILKQRGLTRIYQERLKLLPIVVAMEDRGITISGERLEELRGDYETESGKAGRVCRTIAGGLGCDLVLPKSGNNKSLTDFVFGPLGLKAEKSSKKTGKPSLDKSVLEHWEATLPAHSKALTFVKSLKGKRKRDTALNYMEGYRKFWIPLTDQPDWFCLHPSLNATGTDTLRWSSQNPNEQNISKQEGFNLRYMFGPASGREWWSLDAKNIELRLPAYESGETDMIDLFERPDDPPYYGSNHLLVFDILHPDLFAKYGKDVKKLFASTWYQWTKNGNFAVTYGAVEQSGTADRAYHVTGAQHIINSRFTKIKQLNERMIEFAQKNGYVETMPDKTVDPKRGYPLLCSRNNWGSISPTIPLNYHVQGSACWWMMKAMIRCQALLDDYNANQKPEYKAYMVMQIHDEVVFDFPFVINKGNLPILRNISKLMEKSGDDLGVPTPVSLEYHPNNWSDGESA